MTERMPIVTRDLSVRYGGIAAVTDVNVNIPPRMITAIIGPSGCGKSTLLRSFNRLAETVPGAAVTGTVLIDGEDIYAAGTDVTQVRKKMGLLSQRPYPLPMSIFDNVAYGPRIHGTRNRRVLAELVERQLRMASLWDEVKDRLHEPAARLSIGQQQRLCLARGLAVEPQIILADEPTSALDPQSSRKIEEGFRALRERYTIVMVTHILRQARRMADHVIFMYMGAVIEQGPARELFASPRHELTREYVQGVIS